MKEIKLRDSISKHRKIFPNYRCDKYDHRMLQLYLLFETYLTHVDDFYDAKETLVSDLNSIIKWYETK